MRMATPISARTATTTSKPRNGWAGSSEYLIVERVNHRQHREGRQHDVASGLTWSSSLRSTYRISEMLVTRYMIRKNTAVRKPAVGVHVKRAEIVAEMNAAGSAIALNAMMAVVGVWKRGWVAPKRAGSRPTSPGE